MSIQVAFFPSEISVAWTACSRSASSLFVIAGVENSGLVIVPSEDVSAESERLDLIKCKMVRREVSRLVARKV